MTSRAPEPADLGPLSGCAAELAEAFVSLASDIALVIDEHGVIQSVAQSSSAPIYIGASQWVGRPWVDTVTGAPTSTIGDSSSEMATPTATIRVGR